jgi:hypothetical protein
MSFCMMSCATVFVLSLSLLLLLLFIQCKHCKSGKRKYTQGCEKGLINHTGPTRCRKHMTNSQEQEKRLRQTLAWRTTSNSTKVTLGILSFAAFTMLALNILTTFSQQATSQWWSWKRMWQAHTHTLCINTVWLLVVSYCYWNILEKTVRNMII